jgi:hypothetical protein
VPHVLSTIWQRKPRSESSGSEAIQPCESTRRLRLYKGSPCTSTKSQTPPTGQKGHKEDARERPSGESEVIALSAQFVQRKRLIGSQFEAPGSDTSQKRRDFHRGGGEVTGITPKMICPISKCWESTLQNPRSPFMKYDKTFFY